MTIVIDCTPPKLEDLLILKTNRKMALEEIWEKNITGYIKSVADEIGELDRNQFLVDLIDNFKHLSEVYNHEQALGLLGLFFSVKEIYNPMLFDDLEIIEKMIEALKKTTEI